MNRFTTKLAIGLMRTVGCLPLKINRALGSLLGSGAYLLNNSAAQVTRKNVSICMPHIKGQAQDQFVLNSLRETGKTASEICYVWQRSVARSLSLIEAVDGEQHLLDALEKGRGVLVLAPHLGNWELLGSKLTQYASVTNLYQPPKQMGFDSFLRASRTKNGSRIVPTNSKGVAALLKSLKNNEICGILPDQNPNSAGSGAFVPFFGESAFTMTLVYKLVSRTQCSAIFAFAKRTSKGFRIVFKPAPDNLYSDNQANSLRGLNAGIENLIREAPAQYHWEYKRFKVHNPERPVNHYN